MKPGTRICTEGLVYCPLRRLDATLETCLACEWLDDVSTPRTQSADAAPTVVRCTPPSSVRSTSAGWVV